MYLIANRCNRDLADEDGLTPLHHAAFKAPHYLSKLITPGNVNSVDLSGKSALHYLSSMPRAIFDLSEAGANLQLANKKG